MKITIELEKKVNDIIGLKEDISNRLEEIENITYIDVIERG